MKKFLIALTLVSTLGLFGLLNQHAAVMVARAQSENANALKPTSVVTPMPVAVHTDAVPSLESFTQTVRAEGRQGLWAEGQFAYLVENAAWGLVPDEMNTAAYASFQDYHAYFIHNVLGGSQLYHISPGTKIAAIYADHIDWFMIDESIRYYGTQAGNACQYQEPFYRDGKGAALSAFALVQAHYGKPFAIQTSVCEDGKVGIQILTGTRLEQP